MPKVSVIIPTYNSWNTLDSCIQSIKHQSMQPDEIIVVNNGSTDGTGENIRNTYPEITLLNLSTNTGVTGGRNTGITHATGDILLFFDHDMVAEYTMIEELKKILDSNSKIGIVTPKIYYYEEKKIIWSAGTDINLISGQNIFRSGEDKGQYEQDLEVAIAPATLMVSRAVINAIKEFDNTYFAVYEDTDFCFRARNAGYLTFYAHKAIAYHKIPYNPDTSNKRLLERTYWIARNRIIFMRKFGKNFVLFIPFLFVYLFYYLLLSCRYNYFSAIPNYIKGVIAGLSYKSTYDTSI